MREPAGSALPGIAPSSVDRCSDGGVVLVAGSGDAIFKRLMSAIGRDDLGADPELATTPAASSASTSSTAQSRPKLLGTPGRVGAAAPKLGELGFSQQHIAALRGRKVVA